MLAGLMLARYLSQSASFVNICSHNITICFFSVGFSAQPKVQSFSMAGFDLSLNVRVNTAD